MVVKNTVASKLKKEIEQMKKTHRRIDVIEDNIEDSLNTRLWKGKKKKGIYDTESEEARFCIERTNDLTNFWKEIKALVSKSETKPDYKSLLELEEKYKSKISIEETEDYKGTWLAYYENYISLLVELVDSLSLTKEQMLDILENIEPEEIAKDNLFGDVEEEEYDFVVDANEDIFKMLKSTKTLESILTSKKKRKETAEQVEEEMYNLLKIYKDYTYDILVIENPVILNTVIALNKIWVALEFSNGDIKQDLDNIKSYIPELAEFYNC